MMNKTIQRVALTVSIVGGLWVASLTVRADAGETLEELKAKISELDQKVRILERNRELETQSAESKAKESPKIAIGSQGFVVASADTNFVVKLRGVLQLDSRTFFDDGGIQGNDSFLLRRARPVIEGTVFRDFDFLFVPDFGVSSSPQTANSAPVIQDAYLNYRYEPWLQLRAGKYKVPVGLEQLQSDPVTLFNERSLATGLTPNRDLGGQLWGDVADGRLSYAVGIFNGIADGRNSFNGDFEDHREFAGRLFLQPFKKSGVATLQGLGFGVSGSWGNLSSNALGLAGGFLTDGQQQFFAYTNGVVADGTHWRLSPQAYYYYGPFGLLGEYVLSDQQVRRGAFSSDLQNTAWHVAGSWVLTGEGATYSGVTPRRPFNLHDGQWGAVQLVGRYATLDLDNATFPTFANPVVSATAARAWSVGLNWYLNKNVRLNTSFSRTSFKGGGGAGTTAPATVTRQDENALFTRVQLAF